MAAPLLLPILKYPPFNEKSMQFGLITLKFVAGKFENTVIDGRCSNFTAFSLTSEAMATISEVGLNFMLEIGVTKFKTIFSGVGFGFDQHDFLL